VLLDPAPPLPSASCVAVLTPVYRRTLLIAILSHLAPGTGVAPQPLVAYPTLKFS